MQQSQYNKTQTNGARVEVKLKSSLCSWLENMLSFQLKTVLDLVPKCKESSLFGNCLSSRTPDSFEIMLTPYCFPFNTPDLFQIIFPCRLLMIHQDFQSVVIIKISYNIPLH